MKPTKFHAATTLLSIALAAVMVGCGGGGDDEAGSPTAFSVQPETKTVTSTEAGGACAVGYVGDFFVYGGTAPYRLNVSDPDAVLLHKSITDPTPVTTVSDRGGSFSVSFTGICLAPSSVMIVDKLDNQVVLTLNNKPAS
jgi:hypothetical protein